MKSLSQHYINGQWVSSIGGNAMPVENPSTEATIGTITLGTSIDVDVAVSAAKEAFIAWAATDLNERITLLERLLDIYNSRADEMAQAISNEMGAPIALARKAQVAACLLYTSPSPRDRG